MSCLERAGSEADSPDNIEVRWRDRPGSFNQGCEADKITYVPYGDFQWLDRTTDYSTIYTGALELFGIEKSLSLSQVRNERNWNSEWCGNLWPCDNQDESLHNKFGIHCSCEDALCAKITWTASPTTLTPFKIRAPLSNDMVNAATVAKNLGNGDLDSKCKRIQKSDMGTNGNPDSCKDYYQVTEKKGPNTQTLDYSILAFKQCCDQNEDFCTQASVDSCGVKTYELYNFDGKKGVTSGLNYDKQAAQLTTNPS